MPGENKKDEILLGAGELYLHEFSGSTIPEHDEIEIDENNVGHCSGGASIDYKPNKYDIKNQYGRTVKSVITSEEINFKSGILTWDLKKLKYLSAAEFKEYKSNGKRTLTFKGGGSLPNVLVRFVHTKDDGKKLRFTMIGQGGNGFALEFGEKELTVDADISAIEYIKNFLAEIEEEIEISSKEIEVKTK